MNQVAVDVLNSYITTAIMLILWLLTIGVVLSVSRVFRLPGLYGFACGMFPKVIFYSYKLFNVWDLGPLAILYSRLADISLAISIIVSMWMMYRGYVNGLEELADN